MLYDRRQSTLESAKRYASNDGLALGVVLSRDERNIRTITNELRSLPYSHTSLSSDFLPDVTGDGTVFIYLVDGKISITCKWENGRRKNLAYKDAARFILEDKTKVCISKHALQLLERSQTYALTQLIKHYGEVY